MNINEMKIDLINDFARKIKNKNENELLPFFLATMNKAKENNISFTDEETDIILNELKTKLSVSERKKIDTVRSMIQILNGHT